MIVAKLCFFLVYRVITLQLILLEINQLQKILTKMYAELGARGGRKGPKSEPVESNYAQVKVDEMGYPARGPASDMSQPARTQQALIVIGLEDTVLLLIMVKWMMTME